MIIGKRLRQLREAKRVSQGDVEKRTGLLPCYTSRVENGHTVPSIQTLEKYAKALEEPLYRFFYDGEIPSEMRKSFSAENSDGSPGNNAPELRLFARAFAKMKARDRRLILLLAAKMVRKAERLKGGNTGVQASK